MIRYEVREAIVVMQAQGCGVREISRTLKVSRNTVRRVLRDVPPGPARENPQQQAIAGLLPDLYRRCKGNAVRIQERLREQYDTHIPYSTLTRLLREQELRQPKARSGIYTFEPGQEMQHDTSPHRVALGEGTVLAQCASLILAYSRYLFMQYYPCFTRFEAKAFLSEAFRFFDGVCPRCTIDNTHVVVASGSGPDAVIAPEMEAFGHLFGTAFVPHAIGHADRKDYVSHCTSFVRFGSTWGKRRRCTSLRPWALTGGSSPGCSYRHSPLSL